MPTKRVHMMGEYATLRNIGVAVTYIAAYKNPRRIGPHSHDILEMCYIVRGTATHLIDAEEVPLKKGTLAITPYDQSHEIVTPPEGVEKFNLFLDPDKHALPRLPGELSALIARILPLHPRRTHSKARLEHRLFPRRMVSLDLSQSNTVEPLLRLILEEQTREQVGYEEAIYRLYELFLIECARAIHNAEGSLPADGVALEGVESVCARMERDFALPLTLSTLANEQGWDPSYLCRRFKAYLGITVFQYLTRCRIQQSMVQLRNGNAKILSIAMECGFGDLSHFNRTFRKLVGVSPREYRQRFARAEHQQEA